MVLVVTLLRGARNERQGTRKLQPIAINLTERELIDGKGSVIV